jgi:hypothetical protein
MSFLSTKQGLLKNQQIAVNMRDITVFIIIRWKVYLKIVEKTCIKYYGAPAPSFGAGASLIFFIKFGEREFFSRI